jgi:hypothetical protein
MTLGELQRGLIEVFKRLSVLLIVPKQQGKICAGDGPSMEIGGIGIS